MSNSSSILSLIQKAEYTHNLTKAEIVSLLKTEDDYLSQEIYSAADRVRKKYVGDEVHLRGLIEFSNICKQTCLYCGLRSGNKNLKRYRLEPEDIIKLTSKAKNYGYRTIVLQSGEDEYYDADRMVFIIEGIKRLDVALTLSIGEKTFEVYEKYKKAGADRYLLRIETTDKKLYESLDPNMNWDNRVKCLQFLKELKFELGTGCMVGLKGQSIESLADDILFFKNIEANMIGIGPFIANPDTPLGSEPNGNIDLSLRVMAVTRLLLPDINIPATTALESIHPDGRLLALKHGANVVMPNVTEGEYRQLYKLYPGKICTDDTPAHCRTCITDKIKSIGRTVSENQGFSESYKKTLE